MALISKIISSAITNGKILIKLLVLGKYDIREAKQISPFGIDSNPTNDKRGLFISTSTIGKYYSVGIINTNCKSQPGETRLFSTNSQGIFKYNIWLRADGTMLQGDSDNPAVYTNFAVKYNESKSEQDKLKATVDSLVTKWNAFVLAYVPGSPSNIGTPPTLAGSNITPNTSNFALIKNDKIKTN